MNHVRSKSMRDTSTRSKPPNVRMMSLPEGKLYHTPELEYKEVVQKLVVRQACVKKGDDKRRQKHLVNELRQDLCEIRYEAQESFQAMHQELQRAEQPSTDAPPIEEDIYASDTLKAMHRLLQANNNESAKKEDK